MLSFNDKIFGATKSYEVPGISVQCEWDLIQVLPLMIKKRKKMLMLLVVVAKCNNTLKRKDRS